MREYILISLSTSKMLEELKWNFSVILLKLLRTLELSALATKFPLIQKDHLLSRILCSIELSQASWLKEEISRITTAEVVNLFTEEDLTMRISFTST